MIYVATYIDVQVGSTAEGIRLIKQYRAEAVQEMSRANRFVIIEVWNDPAAFEAHERSDGTAQFRSKLQAIHNSPYDRRVHHAFAIDPRPRADLQATMFVVTHVDVPPPRKDETEVLLKAIAEESRSLDGNVRYDVFQQNAPRTNHFTVVAGWRDRRAFDSYELSPHTRRFREAVGPLLGAPYDERLYKLPS